MSRINSGKKQRAKIKMSRATELINRTTGKKELREIVEEPAHGKRKQHIITDYIKQYKSFRRIQKK